MNPSWRRQVVALMLAVGLVTLSVLAALAQAAPAHTAEAPLQTSHLYLPIVIKSPPPPPPPPPPAALVNGNFESGAAGWVEYSEQGYVIILEAQDLPIPPHSGNWAAWLGGAYDEASLLGQVFTVPRTATRLAYYLWIASGDVCSADYDIGGVTMDSDGDITEDDVLDAYILCSDTSTGGWVRREVDISRYAGQEVMLTFAAFTDSTLNSNMFIDDVSLTSAPQQLETASSGEPLFIVPARPPSPPTSPHGVTPGLQELRSGLQRALNR
ncbi:MAG: hypothetical protein RRC07_10555 [Anaerolineae bacterium]|nr:hypothetical protein [Anaerolineae bacterium]